jgi:uncharacterized membrane protein YkgB
VAAVRIVQISAECRTPPSAVQRVASTATGWLAAHSITALRVSLGLVFLGFGALKFVPGASPAEALVIRTFDTLSLGLVSGTTAVETFIGLTLLTGVGLLPGLVVMAGVMPGIMSPLVLFFGDLFPGYPTLEAQYVLKDVVLVTAGAVVAAQALGARYVLSRPRLRR